MSEIRRWAASLYASPVEGKSQLLSHTLIPEILEDKVFVLHKVLRISSIGQYEEIIVIELDM